MQGLKIDPKIGSSVQSLGKEPRGLGRDAAFSSHDLVNTLRRNPDVLGKSYLRDLQGDEKLTMEDFARVGRYSILGQHERLSRSMVVGQADFVGYALGPAEDDPPLFVHAHAMETAHVATQGL